MDQLCLEKPKEFLGRPNRKISAGGGKGRLQVEEDDPISDSRSPNPTHPRAIPWNDLIPQTQLKPSLLGKEGRQMAFSAPEPR